MKPSKKIMLLTSCALAIFALAACGSNQKQSKEKQESSTVQKSSSDKERYKGSYSNLNSKASVDEVRTLLSTYLDQDSVDKFLGLVTDYDSIVGSVGLTGDFSKFKKTDYNVEKISDLWTKKKGDFVGTNCRINSYTLLKNRIEIPKMKADSELLFVDNDAIDKGKIFDEAFCIHGFRQRRQQMSRSMPRRWKNTLLISSSMKMRACFLSSFMITLTVIPFLLVTWAFWYLPRTAISLSKS